MTSLVAFGLDQIQRGTWWNDSTEPWRSNIAARRRSEEHRQCLLRMIQSSPDPVGIKEASDRTGLSIASIRNLLKPALEAGQIRRVTIGGVVHLEARK